LLYVHIHKNLMRPEWQRPTEKYKMCEKQPKTLNRTPLVFQYIILSNNWGAVQCFRLFFGFGEVVQKRPVYGKIGATGHKAVRVNGVHRKGKQGARNNVAGQN
jgi:hypothetical protein